MLLKKNKTIERQTVTTATKGLATGSWMRVPTTTAETKAETTSTLYDYKYRPIRTYTANYLGGYTNTDSKLDAFSGLLQYTVQNHKRTSSDSELAVKEAFTYSSQKRLLTHTHQINGGAEQLLADNTYDELGKLTSKKVGNTSALPLQNVNYSYNVRGWLTQINEIKALQKGTDPKDLFGFKINYNSIDADTAVANPLYNGNIAETFWQFGDDGDLVYRGYGYKYDSLNRLKDASYQRPGFNNPVPKSYDENLTYDKNGNIMSLKRNGDADDQLNLFTIDDLSYEYLANSNKLMRVSEAQPTATSGFKDGNTTGDDYAYDANGNMTVDKNKNITAITYNHLNLPTKIIFTTGNIVYIYTASGQKMQKIVTDGTNTTTTDYLGGYQYQNTVLQFFPTAEGYVKNTPISGTNSYSYVFNYTDHLGNVRISYTQNPSTNALTILDENSYYPFGLKHTISNAVVQGQDYKYQYNGKELQDELGLNSYDFGARNYDAALGKFMNIDPKAEQYSFQSTYAFANNNPIFYIDFNGEGVNGDYFTEEGKYLGNDGVDDKKVYSVKEEDYKPIEGKKGTYSISKSTELKWSSGNSVNIDDFKFMSSVLYAESSGGFKETLGIFNVLENRATQDGNSVLDQFTDKSPYGVYGVRDTDRLADESGTPLGDTKRANVYKALINGITTNTDITNGGYFWDGKDFNGDNRVHGGYNVRYKPGYTFTNPAHDLWGQGNNKTNRIQQYESTNAIGSTTFSRLINNSGKRWTGGTLLK